MCWPSSQSWGPRLAAPPPPPHSRAAGRAETPCTTVVRGPRRQKVQEQGASQAAGQACAPPRRAEQASAARLSSALGALGPAAAAGSAGRRGSLSPLRVAKQGGELSWAPVPLAAGEGQACASNRRDPQASMAGRPGRAGVLPGVPLALTPPHLSWPCEICGPA